MPPMPPWSGLHPLVVHFPIALLAAAPVLVALGMLFPRARGILPSAFVLTLLATAGAFLAVGSGEAAGQVAERLPGVAPLLERHEELAEATRTLAAVLTLASAGLLGAPWALRREPSRGVRLGCYAALLALHAAAFGAVAATAHAGGRLVHEKGLRAMMAPPSAAPLEGSDPVAEGRERR